MTGRSDHGEGANEGGRNQLTQVIAVPAKPSAAMLADGARAGGVSVTVAFHVYQAMISKGFSQS